ncbi:MICOS complex subunit MIC60 [Hypsizygus marmoreus]|uniref:MICOS complex subunit MIC60 n=1 Tax=Hypsizygus marmoreus TaxID=39966 RepID=A0A369JU87_HYPMA|nr:MICOS complex subunit MIC60 [Hypsizygus marmoreus]
MYRALPISRRVASSSKQGAVRVIRRRLATESAPTPIVPKKKKRIVRKIFWTTAGLTGTFYVGSTFAAFYNQRYYDFFSDQVPLGQSMLEYAEAHHWDTLTVGQVVESGKNTVITVQRFVTDQINRNKSAQDIVDSVKHAAEKTAKEAKSVVSNVVSESKTRVESMAASAKKEIEKEADKITHKAAALAKHRSEQAAEGLSELAREAEKALESVPKPLVPSDTSETTTESTPSEPTPPSTESIPLTPETPSPLPPIEISQKVEDSHVYEAPLPVGFEPPPGYTRPSPLKKAEPEPVEPASIERTPVALPLIAPAVSSLSASEPIITQLAGTIDNLASYIAANPDAAPKVSDVLETAKTDLTALADRIEQAKQEERAVLEAKLDDQTREYTLKLLELEMEAQDKLDSQEEGFRKFFDQEKMKTIQAYRAKLEQELRTQTELINERLKEEVIAQGIELQRRWIREIKVRVEQERGGRLGKLEELSSHLKRLERVALDNSTYLDENIRIHALWSSVRALTSSALTSPVRKPFREELRVLRHITSAREDPVVAATLESLEASDVPDIGVEPFADLATWFASDVAPKVSHVALVPDENAGVLSYLASHLLSGLRFRRQGLVVGDDVLSVIARAEYYLNEKDLDSAARELNQLKGAAKILLHDWLEAARRRLEVEQALQVVQTEATLASLLVV